MVMRRNKKGNGFVTSKIDVPPSASQHCGGGKRFKNMATTNRHDDQFSPLPGGVSSSLCIRCVTTQRCVGAVGAPRSTYTCTIISKQCENIPGHWSGHNFEMHIYDLFIYMNVCTKAVVGLRFLSFFVSYYWGLQYIFFYRFIQCKINTCTWYILYICWIWWVETMFIIYCNSFYPRTYIHGQILSGFKSNVKNTEKLLRCLRKCQMVLRECVHGTRLLITIYVVVCLAMPCD